MKLIKKGTAALQLAASFIVYSCGPNDNRGSMDQNNSKGEGAIDSSRLTHFDTSSLTTGNDSNKLK
ncbi:MAG: hypothetical protein M3040_14405 [Bacteroidota bacterium]|nr:hypothetical protein [Bacteroidota bacterium]